MRLRRLGAVLGVAAVASLAFVYRRELGEALAALHQVDWRVLGVLPLFWVWNHAAALGWRGLVAATAGDPPSAWTLARVRIEAQAVNLTIPSASVGGEVLKTARLGAHGGVAAGATSVALDTTASSAAAALFTVAGLAAAWRSPVLDGAARDALLVTGAVVLAAVLAAPWWLRPALALVHRLRAAWTRRRQPGRQIANDQPARPTGEVARAFRRAVLWHLLERALSVGEILLAARALGLPLTLPGALFATAVMTASTTLLFFIPAQAGAAEGGLAVAFAAFGLPPAGALSVALVRRARQLVVAAVGLGTLALAEGPGAARLRSLERQEQAHANPLHSAG